MRVRTRSTRPLRPLRPAVVAAASGAASLALCVAGPCAAAWANGGGNSQGSGPLHVKTILSGTSLSHMFVSTLDGMQHTESLSDPDDITLLGDEVFVGFQNGVGPQGQPSRSGNTDSTVVEFTTSGQPVAQWDVTGKTDGVTADPALHAVIATVNEDANSSLYTITPATNVVQNFSYSGGQPLPHFGGTDAISILNGQILISASAPGTTGGSAPGPYPAVYSVTLDPATSTATITSFFGDEDPATVANVGSTHGQSVTLQLTDPDSNEIVPLDAPRFGGEFMLTSQGDQEQIFVHQHRGAAQTLSVLNLSQSVDDTAWPDSQDGTLFATDSTNDAVDAITGEFPENPVVAVTPCDSNAAAQLTTCPAPPQFPANYLGTLNPWTGHIDPLGTTGAAFVPQGGLLFVPSDQDAQR